MTAAATTAQAPARAVFGFGIVWLLALAIFINYVDRGNLATAAPLIENELHLSHTRMGVLLSSFFWTYAPSMILVGLLQERIGAYRAMALGLAIWSIATVLSGLATGFAMLIGLRLVLGMGESVAFPCSSKLLARNLPQSRLGAANGLIGMGLAFGPAFGTYFGGMLMHQVGWRWMFIGFGLVSSLWLIPWILATRRLPHDAAPKGEAAPSYLAVLKRRDLWGVSIGHFCMNYAFYVVITWLPTYLVKARGFTVPQMAELSGLIYLVYGASALSAGWLADRAIGLGLSVNVVRKACGLITSFASAGGLLLCAIGDERVTIAGLFIAAVGFGFGTSSIYSIGQTLAGPRAGGKWMSVQNALANIPGIIAPIVTGWLVDVSGSFAPAFAVSSAIAILGSIAFVFVIKKVAPLEWGKTAGVL
jgi:MFS family permease